MRRNKYFDCVFLFCFNCFRGFSCAFFCNTLLWFLATIDFFFCVFSLKVKLTWLFSYNNFSLPYTFSEQNYFISLVLWSHRTNGTWQNRISACTVKIHMAFLLQLITEEFFIKHTSDWLEKLRTDLQCKTPVGLNRKAEFQNLLGLVLVVHTSPLNKTYGFIHTVSLIRCSIVLCRQWLKLLSNWIQETSLHPSSQGCCSGEIRFWIKRAITTYTCFKGFWKSDKPISTVPVLLKKKLRGSRV